MYDDDGDERTEGNYYTHTESAAEIAAAMVAEGRRADAGASEDLRPAAADPNPDTHATGGRAGLGSGVGLPSDIVDPEPQAPSLPRTPPRADGVSAPEPPLAQPTSPGTHFSRPVLSGIGCGRR